MFKLFLKDKSGVTSIEFAFLAPIFFALMFAFLETGWLMTKMVMLENSVASSSRLIYTGKAPTQGALEDEICKKNPLIINCKANINIEMQTITKMEDKPSADMNCRDSDNTDYSPAVNYHSSAGAEIVYLRVCVMTDVIAPGIGLGLALPKTDTGRHSIIAASAFMNEPF